MTSKRMSRGQSLVEYLILTALLAVASIATAQFFGASVRQTMAAIAMELAGSDGTPAREGAAASAEKGQTEAEKKHGMDSFTGNARKQ